MKLLQLLLVTLALTCGFFHCGISDGLKSHGEACSLRSQVANLFRDNDSPEGCMSSKGLVCLNHKCVCADPSNVFEEPEKQESPSTGSSIASAASNFFNKLMKSGSTTTQSPTTATTVPGGKCVGRAGSPCFTQNSTCVRHATCEGSPRLCKCQGIYSSNAQGMCSKTASVVQQVIKQTVG